MTRHIKLLHIAAALLAVTSLHAFNAGDIITKDKVGAGAMPAEISAVTEAPFKMKGLKAPVFKDRKVIISQNDISATGLITPAINEKIRKMSEKGGGTVVVPQGTWRSGRITLMSNVNLRVERGAVLEFSGSVDDYQPAVFTRHEGVEVMGAGAFIYANGAENIALTGEGVISGPPMDAAMRSLRNGNSVVEKDIDANTPVAERLCDGRDGRTFYRPKSFAPINCRNVLVQGVTFEKSVLWNVNPIYCDNVIIRGITVNSTKVPSGDGIDISSCRNVLIEYCTLNCGDDCFTLKAGRCEDGLRVNRPTENVLIRYCLSKDGHGGITCGSETAGTIRNVYLHSCVFYGTRVGFRFKTRRNRGGGISDILYENVRLVDVREAFTWDLLGTPMYMGELARRNPPLDITELTPVVRNITIRNFIVESADRLISVHGIPEIPCANVLIENGTVRTNRIFKSMDDIDGLTLRHMDIHATDNTMNIDDGRNITFDRVNFHVPCRQLDFNIKGSKAGSIFITDGTGKRACTPGKNDI